MHQRTCFCTERIVSNNDFLQQYFKETNSVKRRLKLFGETKINTVHLHFISLSRDFQIKIRDYFFPLFCAYFIAAVQFVISICNIIYINTAVGWFACEETTHLPPCRTVFFFLLALALGPHAAHAPFIFLSCFFRLHERNRNHLLLIQRSMINIFRFYVSSIFDPYKSFWIPPTL